MSYEKMTFEERVDWSAGHILKGLIAGNFRSAVWTVVDMAHRYPFNPAVKPRRPRKTDKNKRGVK